MILPKPFDWQRQVKQESKRFNVVDVGRRAGKTALGLDLCVSPETLPYPVGWFSPTYKMLLEVWREAVRTFAPILTRRNVQERRLEFLTGGLLEFWSLDNPDVARGRKYKRVIVDEAAMVPALMESWQYAIRPTLADYKGDAWFLSTPKGRNGFWQLWQWGQDKHMQDWASWQMPSSVNPLLDAGEIDEMRRTMPERTFRQEIEAAFVEDGGGVFRRVTEAATAKTDTGNRNGHRYVMGVDLARTLDFTVVVILDITRVPYRMVYMDRFNQISWQVQVQRIKAAVERFRVDQVVVDQTGVGDPVIEQLRRELAL